MSVNLRHLLMEQLPELRHEPIEKRIRAVLGDRTVVDTTAALLVWEPRRVVPSYAVPDVDIDGELTESALGAGVPGPDGVAAMGAPHLGDRSVYDPSIPFAVHTTEGVALTLTSARGALEGAAFHAAPPELDGYVLLDFDAFDEWYEEDERNVGHPRDPFHRIDFVRSTRHVVVEIDGTVVADSSSPFLVFESPLPVRYYLPPDHVRLDLLEPSATRTTCAYKGLASYWSFGDEADVGWTYPRPQREATDIIDHIAFFNERVDITVDGRPAGRPVTPWSKR